MTTMAQAIAAMAAEIDALGGKHGDFTQAKLMLAVAPGGRSICADLEFEESGVQLQQYFDSALLDLIGEDRDEWKKLEKHYEQHLAAEFLALRVRADIARLKAGE